MTAYSALTPGVLSAVRALVIAATGSADFSRHAMTSRLEILVAAVDLDARRSAAVTVSLMDLLDRKWHIARSSPASDGCLGCEDPIDPVGPRGFCRACELESQIIILIRKLESDQV